MCPKSVPKALCKTCKNFVWQFMKSIVLALNQMEMMQMDFFFF